MRGGALQLKRNTLGAFLRDTAGPPTVLEIARRAVAAQVTAEFGISADHYTRASSTKQADIISNHQRMLDWMTREGILEWLTPRERSFFDTGLTQYSGDPDDAAFELECVGVLLWSLGLADAGGTSTPSNNDYLDTLHASDPAPDEAIVADSGLDALDSEAARSVEQLRVMADAYRLQLWRLDLVLRDKKARVDMRAVAPQLIGEFASAALESLSLYERNGDLIFDAASLVFYELNKRDIPWIQQMFVHRLKTLEWLLGGVSDWDGYAPKLLTRASN